MRVVYMRVGSNLPETSCNFKADVRWGVARRTQFRERSSYRMSTNTLQGFPPRNYSDEGRVNEYGGVSAVFAFVFVFIEDHLNIVVPIFIIEMRSYVTACFHARWCSRLCI